MSRDFLVLGYFGAANFGDDLMLRGLVPLLRELRPSSVVNVVSYYDRELPIEESDGVRVVRARSTTEKLCKLVPLFARRPIAMFGGGTPFTDTEGDGSYKFFRLAHLLGCEFGYLGVGIGHLTRPERRARARWLLSHCRAAMFRDRKSLSRAIELIGGTDERRFILGEDLAYLDVPHWNDAKPHGTDPSGELLLSWRELDGEVGAPRHERLRRALTRAVQTLWKESSFTGLTLLHLDPGADLEVHRKLRHELRDALPGVDVRLVEESGISATVRTIARAPLLLCVRLHGVFAGKSLGTSTVGFEYSPKVRYYFESIGARSVLTWEELEADPHCLVRMAAMARQEASRVPDAQGALRMARQGVEKFLEVFG